MTRTPTRVAPGRAHAGPATAAVLVAVLGVCVAVCLAATAHASSAPLERIRESMDRGSWRMAAAELDLFISETQSADDEATARLMRARIWRSRGDDARVLADLDVIERLDGPLAVTLDALFLRGEVLYESGDYAGAQLAFGRFYTQAPLDPRVARARWLRAEALARQGDCTRALGLYESLLRVGSADVRQRAHFGHGWCARALGREEQALEDFRIAAAGTDPDVAGRARFEAGASCYRLGRHAEALEWLQDDIAALDPRGELMVAQSLFALGHEVDALPRLERVLASAEGSERATLTYQIGWAEMAAGDYEKALGRFTELSSMTGVSDSLRTATAYATGVAMLRLDRLQDAVGPLERVRGRRDTPFGDEARYALAYTYHRLGDYERSQTLIDELTRLYPESPLVAEASLVGGENLFLSERFDDAAAAYRARLTRSSGDGDRADVLFRLAVSAYKLGQFAEAEESFRELILRYPDSPHRADARFWLAESLYRQERFDEARESYRAIRIADPDGPRAADALYGEGWCDYRQGRFEDASERFTDLLDRFRDTGREDDLLFRRAMCQLRLDRVDLAARDLGALLARYPQSRLAERALVQLASALERTGNVADARARYDEITRRYPESPEVPYALTRAAALLHDEGRYADASLRVERVLARTDTPDSVRTRARLQLGQCQYALGQFQDAAATYEPLTASIYPKDVRDAAYAGRVRSLEAAGKTDAAVTAASEHAEVVPEAAASGETMYRIGVEHLEAGRWREGIEALRRYLKAGTPDTYVVDANHRCALASLELGDQLRAAEFYRNAAHHGDVQDGIDFRFEAGRLFYELGKYDLARDEFERVVRLKPDEKTRVTALFNLGLAFKETGQTDKALDAFESVGKATSAEAAVRADALLEAGLIARDRGDLQRAKRHLSRAAELGTGAVGAEAQYWVADLDFDSERYEDAIGGYRRVVEQFADQQEWRISARYRMAEAFERLSRWRDAEDQYQHIVEASGDASWTEDAQRRLDWIKENPWIFEEQPTGDPSR